MGFIILVFCTTGFTQNPGKITGRVTDHELKPLPYANVVLFTAADSLMIKGEITDDHGDFTLELINPGEYWVEVSYVGLPTLTTHLIIVKSGETTKIPEISLQSPGKDLTEVVVTSKKALIEVKPDKMVFNVAGSINATGNDALELLRKSPGVVVDNNNNIMLQGKNGVRVYLDGKASPLSTADLADFLKTIQSSEIESIEIITSPSARYEAEGNAGIINIKFKKDQNLGANGSFDVGVAQGKKNQYSVKAGGNFRQKLINLFGSYGWTEGQQWNFMDMYREQNKSSFNQHNTMQGHYKNHNVRAGVDFFITKKNTIGVLYTGTLNDFLWESKSQTDISALNSSRIDSFLVATSNTDGGRGNHNFNINYKWAGEAGRSFNFDVDYGIFNNDRASFQPNAYYRFDNNLLLQTKSYRNITPTGIRIFTVKADYEMPFAGGLVALGGKYALVKTDNEFNVYDVIGDSDILDLDRSNQFYYSENVNAAYLNYSKKLKVFSFQLGVRLEQTESIGDLQAAKETNDEYVRRNYTNLFPSGGLSWQPSKNHSFNLVYSERITRPNYQDLNPFENRLDELTFEKGNAFLNPQYGSNFQITHTYKHIYNTSLSYSHTKDLITRITDISSGNASYITWLNLAEQDNVAMTFSAPLTVNKWWSSFNNLGGSWTSNRADYGEGKVIDISALSFNLYSQQSISLPKKWKLELSGWYQSPGVWGGTFNMKSMYNIDFGIQKKILQNKGNLKLTFTDLFLTNQWHGESQFGQLYMDIRGGYDSRRVRLNFNYLIGKETVKSARKRSTGLEEEQNRIKSEN